ncbi:MAG: asparagine synthase (glutamine-hydrolyzing) [Campylobacterota bacterium]
MCGVFGIIGDYSPHQARAALARISHRGRDHCGTVEEAGVFFAHQRLSITDLHPRARQPMRRGKVLVSFNGEIYNHARLREKLGGEWETRSDTEVLLRAYEAWGIGCLEHLEGMFAFALLDGEKLYLVRDRFGKKPLFYHRGERGFFFASEIKALKPFLPSVRLNSEALHSYLSFLAPVAPHTFYEGIEKLGAGEWLCYEQGEVTRRRYYTLLDAPSSALRSLDEAVDTLDAHLHRSVAMRLPREVPAAALLSGGLDSAMICAVAASQGTKLPVFTLGYDEYGAYDERSNAAQTARYLGLEHTEVVMSQNDFDTHLDDMLDHMDEPLNDPAALPLYLLMRRISSEGYKVVLSGEGSDELFLGYRQYFEYLDIENAASLHHKNWLKKYFHAHFSMNREWEWYKRVFDDTLLFRTSGEKFTDLQQNMLLRRNVRDNESLRFLRLYRELFEGSAHTHPAQWYGYVDLQVFVAEHFLAKLDRVSMAHTLEARTPFLDHCLAEAAFSVDPSVKIGEGKTKGLLKAAARRYLPDEVIDRKKKGFSNPYMEWLIASGRIGLIAEVNDRTGLFHPEAVDKYIDMAHRGRFKQHVWGLYILSHWLKREML